MAKKDAPAKPKASPKKATAAKPKKEKKAKGELESAVT